MNIGQLIVTAIGFSTAIIVTFFFIQKNKHTHLKG